MPDATMVSIGLTGIAVGVGSYLLTPLAGLDERPQVEQDRRDRLRVRSKTYRWFEPTIDEGGRLFREYAPKSVARLEHRLDMLGVEDWRADEMMMAKLIEGIGIALAAGTAAVLLFSPMMGVTLACLMALVLPWILLRTFTTRATTHVSAVRGRLPYSLDLMALMLEAGAGTLRECLEQVTQEHPDEPIGVELGRTLAGIEKGVNTAEMLKALDRRLADPDVKDMVIAIVTAEERGIPLKDALRSLADRMRLKKIQWMEKSAEQAKVKITGPAMVVMAGCMLVVVSPWVVNIITKAF